jgi:hypothetical protein
MPPVSRVAWGALALTACSPVPIQEEPRVGLRAHADGTDQGIVLIYDAVICDVTLRDDTGALHDLRGDGAARAPIDMTRSLPDFWWGVQDSAAGATLLTVLGTPPGRYTIVGYREADGWDTAHTTTGSLVGHTNCSHRSLASRQVHVELDVRAGEVALAALPRGEVGFSELTSILFAKTDPWVGATAGTWLPSIDRAATDKHASLVSAQRQPRTGYAVYPSCDGETAVVRENGTPMPPAREARDLVLSHVGQVRSLHAHGIGAGCVLRRATVVVVLWDPLELDRAVTALGEWLVRDNLAGEVDVMLSAEPSYR